MQKQNRLKAYLIMIISLIPLGTAYTVYFFRENFDFASMRSGELLSPPLPIQSLLPNFEAAGRWQLITLTPKHCDKLCEHQLDLLNKAYLGLGQDKQRVIKRILKVTDAPLSLQEKNVLIVDPQGWIILYYPFPFNPKGVFKDIRRLLKYSHVG
jgi:hypothetical protein